METHAIRPEQSQTVDFSLAYASLELFSGPIAGQDVEVDCGAYGAKFRLDWDVSKLFPYFNAVVHGAQFYETPVYIKFILDDHLCAFYPTEGAFTPVRDFGTAVSFLDTLCAFVMDIHRRRADIVPNHRKYKVASRHQLSDVRVRHLHGLCRSALPETDITGRMPLPGASG
jgi:hypothetical protein